MPRGETYTHLEIEKAMEFAAQLAEWDRRIVEIIAVGSLAHGRKNGSEKLSLVCNFDPEPPNDAVGFFQAVTLLVRDEYEHTREGIGIKTPIEIGFKMDGLVYLPGGEVLKEPEDRILLWPEPENEEAKAGTPQR